MTFIDRLETDLIRACHAQAVPARPWSAAPQRLPRRGRRRTVAVVSAAAVIAAPAIAIGLAPVLRDFEGRTLSTTGGTPPAQQLALLGILRDPSPRARVDPATLHSSLLPEVQGIRRNYIRLLPPAPGFPRQLLYTVTRGNFGPARWDRAVGAYTPTQASNLICVEHVDGGGIGGDCTATDALTSGRWIESSGLDGYGLVPDGVASVILRYPDHPAQQETVTENTFSFRGYAGPSGPVIGGGGQPSPGPTPEFPSSVTWLDAGGGVISTHTIRNTGADSTAARAATG